jgi:integrase
MMPGIGKTGSFYQSTPETESNIRRAITLCAFTSEENEKTSRCIRETRLRLPPGLGTFTRAWSRKAGRQPGSSLNPRRNRRRKVLLRADFFDRIRETSAGEESTLEEYFSAFRLIVAESFGIDGGKQKYDYRAGGRGQWVERVEQVDLVAVTPDRVQRWKVAFLRRAGTDPVKMRSARTSVNSLLRKAKSLFSIKRLRFVGALGLPFSSPFEGVEFEPRQSMRYHSFVNLEQLTAEAVRELPAQELKIFLLASMAGLRRNEIDKLEWSAFCWEQSLLRIENSMHFQTKNEPSRGDVDLDPELSAMFRELYANRTGSFVIESHIRPRRSSTYRHYRCNKIFESLFAWLRFKGVSSANPLHTLRKEFGSRINDVHGIYAASRALRHADIAITSQHYLDKKSRVTVGLGHLLKCAGEKVASSPVQPPDSYSMA